MPFHQRKERFACLVAHRRAGKTVAAVNDVIKRAIEGPRETPYAYFAPFRAQAKSVAWDYFKKYSLPLKGKDPNEAELKVSLVNGCFVQLFGADNADAARGMGFGGVYCDEYGDFRPSVWGNVIRPTLSDRRGWAVFGGTPKGHNQFYDIHRVALAEADWFSLVLKASTSGILHPEELKAAAAQLSDDQYQQEYECSFDAAILGAYYGREMTAVDAEHRILDVPYDPEFPVNVSFDLGYTDDTSLWWYQNIGNEIHLLDHYAESGGTVEEVLDGKEVPGSIVREILKRPYRYGRFWLPHDAKAKTLASGGKSIMEKLARYLGPEKLAIVPNLSVEDGIQAVRAILPRCYFDHKTNKDSTDGVEALRQYQREYDEDKKAFRKIPRHDWTSHPADSFRYLSIAERRNAVPDPPKPPPVFPDIHKLTLDELWERHEELIAQDFRI